MSHKQFWLGVLSVLSVCLIVGTIGWFVNRQAEINAAASVEKARLQVEATQIKQDESTKRTKERWDAVQRLPLLKKKEKPPE